MKDDFTAYRLKRGYSPKTIKSQDSYIKRFRLWLLSQHIRVSRISHQTILSYFFQLKEKGISSQSRRNHLQGIRVYLDYQREIKILTENPAINIRFPSQSNKPIPQPVTEETLQEIYHWFASIHQKNESRKRQHQRDTLVLGLLVFQGLDSGDIERLTTQDIHLKEGTIYIPSSRTAGARTLKLESIQILLLQQYLQQMKDTSNVDGKLFIKSKIQDMVSNIVNKIRNQYHQVIDSRHLRSSVIMNWLKKNHIRRVQYMAGHRSITSTERYKKDDLYDLSQQLSKYHPMK